MHEGFSANIPPQNVEAEQGVIGAALLDNSQIDDLTALVGPEDFFRASHATIWARLTALHEAGQPVDAIALADALAHAKEYQHVGGDATLAAILEATPHAANGAYYAGIVREHSIARQLIALANDTITEVRQRDHLAVDLVERAEKRIFALADRGIQIMTVPLGAHATEARRLFDLRMKGEVFGVPTLFSDLDAKIAGLPIGSLTYLAARPSQGKTAFALSLADNLERFATPTLFLSLEMPAVQLVDRLAAMRSGIAGSQIQSPKFLRHADAEKLRDTYAAMRESRIYLDDSPSLTVSRIGSIVRRAKNRWKVCLVVIDYLSLIEGKREKGDSRQEEVARISRGLKALAKETGLPFLVLAQLNRNLENREDRRPRLADLRESGQTEADADLVILLHRPEYFDPNDQPGVAELIVAKNRNGAIGTVRLTFRKELTRFDNIDLRPEPDDLPISAF